MAVDASVEERKDGLTLALVQHTGHTQAAT